MYDSLVNELPPAASHLKGWPWKPDNVSPAYDSSIKWPKISIVTPSFNQGKFIEETIRSILLQEYPNLEYIIIDGGSTDETIAIIKKYEPWLNCWVSEPDRGQSNAINKGLAKCTGDIFNWLNSDDVYTEGALLEVALAFIKSPSLLAVSGYEKHYGDAIESYIHVGTELKETLAETIEFCEVSQPSTFFKLPAVTQAGGVSEDLHYIMDGEMWIKMLLLNGQENFRKIDKVLVNFRFHVGSKTVSNSVVNNFLFERCSIVADLQRFVGVPKEITTYYAGVIYNSPKVYELNRHWEFDDAILTKKKLKIYFIKKFVIKQFRRRNIKQAKWGIKQLVKSNSLDLFLLKNCLKLMIQKY